MKRPRIDGRLFDPRQDAAKTLLRVTECYQRIVNKLFPSGLRQHNGRSGSALRGLRKSLKMYPAVKTC